MRYLKLFETWVETPKFYRFSKHDMLSGDIESEYKPIDRIMVGSIHINDALVSKGFPDKKRCVHFMDEISFEKFNKTDKWGNNKHNWGNYIYEVLIDDNSLISWVFLLNIGDWFYKYGKINNYLDHEIVKYLETLGFFEYDYDLKRDIDILLSAEVIGYGTIEDLKKTKWWGKYNCFGWTNESVYLKQIKSGAVIKQKKEYKKSPLLLKSDFEELGIEPRYISNFYSSDFGKSVKKLSDELLKSPDDYDKLREKSIRLLTQWKNKLNL